MIKFLKKGIVITVFISLLFQSGGGIKALELKILDPKIEGTFPDWGQLGDVTDLNKTYSDQVTDKIKAVKEQNDIATTDNNISETDKKDIISNVVATSEQTLAIPIEQVDTKWKKRMLVDGLDKANEKTIEGLKKSQIIDTYIDKTSQLETVANPTLIENGSEYNTKATEAKISLSKEATDTKKIAFSTIANNQEKQFEIGYKPMMANESEARAIENKAIYENIWDGADVVLTAESSGFKEDVVLKNKNSQKNSEKASGYQGNGYWIFYYNLELQGLIAKLENNQIHYFDENNKEVAKLNAPVLIDNAGEVSSQTYWDLISPEDYQAGYQIDKNKFGTGEVAQENDQSLGNQPNQNQSNENDLTNTITANENDLSVTFKNTQNNLLESTIQGIGNFWQSVKNVFGRIQAQGETTNNDTLSSNPETDLTVSSEPDQTNGNLTPVEKIGLDENNLTTKNEENNISGNNSVLVLVVNTQNLTYPIDVDPTTYILTQSDVYNTANGKLASNNVNDVKVYDTSKEPTSNYNSNKEVKSTLAFNNTIDEFDLSLANRLAQWSFDENTGSTAEDNIAPASNANLTNSPTWTNGEINRALNFNGTNQYLQIDDADKLSFSSLNFAISAWVKPNNFSADQGVLGKGNSGNWEYYLGTTVNGGIEFTAWQLNGNQHFSLTTPTKTINPSEWSQILINNNDGNQAQLWVNGKLIKETTTFTGSMGNGTADLNIGRANKAGVIKYFNGAIDNVGIYNNYLTDGQIRTIYNNGLSKLVGWWRLNGDAIDSSGLNNDAVNNGATNENNGKYNQGMNFDGTNNLNAGHQTSLSPRTQLSVEAWIKSGAAGTVQKVAFKDDEYSLNICPDGRPIMMIKTSNGWQSTAGTGSSCQDSTAPIVTDDNWHQLMGTYDGKIIRMYTDGKQAAYFYFPGNISRTSNDLLIGSNFAGTLDDVAIYGRVLSTDEAELHFAQSSKASVSTIINFDNSIGYAEYSQLALDNLQVEQSGILQIKGMDASGQSISEKIKLRKGNLQRVLSSKRYKLITELTALNEEGNTSDKSLKISGGKILAFSPFHDANWRYGVTKENDNVTGLWNFDEGEGNLANDVSGSNNTAYLAGGQSNSSWLYQRNISILPVTPVDDYQVKIELNTDNFDYNNAKSDGSDLRFFNTNGVELSYWIKTWNYNATSIIWVKIPKTGTSEFILKYGNLGAVSKSNGSNTFDFYDDFSGNKLDSVKWQTINNGNYLSQNDKLIVNSCGSSWGCAGLISKQTFSRQNLELNFDYKPISGDNLMFGWHDGGTGESYTDLIYAYYNASAQDIRIYEDGNDRGAVGGTWTAGTTYNVKMPLKTIGGNKYQRSTDEVNYTTQYDSSYSTESPLRIGISNYNKSFEIDNLFVRKYALTDSATALGGLILTSENFASQPNWLNSNWQYRTALYINNQNNNDNLTDYQIPVNIDSKLLINAAKMQGDGDDIRFADSDGTTLLNYWYETGINDHPTKLWVKIPAINAKTTKTIYIYYGYSSATAASNFDNVFTKNSSENGLISSWHLDDGTGTTAADSSGNNITLSLVNGPTWQGSDGGQWDGNSGQNFSTGDHLNLDGSDDYLQVPANTNYNFGTNDWTITTWFKPNAISTCDEVFSQNNPYTILRMYCSDANRWEIYNNSLQYIGPEHNMTAGSWYFLALTRKNNHFYLYNNGLLVWDFDVSTNPTNLGNAPWRFGASSWSSEFFNAKYDEIKVFSRSLSSNEIKALYERRRGTAIQPSVSVNGTNLTSSLPQWDENGKYGQALSFDGQNQFLQIPNDDSINPKNQMTVGAWIKPMALKGWLYTKAITMYPPTAVDNYQVKLTLNATNFDYTKAKPDAGDLRFTDNKGNKLNYWIANWDQNGTSTVWVKVAKAGTNKIFMYYGNTNASSETNFDNVFTKNFGESNVVGLWHLDEGSGGTTADTSGFNHTATLNNTPAWQSGDGGQWDSKNGQTFSSGSQLNFNGTNQYLSVPDSGDWDFGTGDFSIDFWVKIPGDTTNQTIIGNRHTGGADNNWNLEFHTTANRLELHTSNTIVGNSSATINVGQWNHIAFTRQSGTDKFYINGANTNSFADGFNYNNGDILYFGKDGVNSTALLNGYLDEIRVIKGRALSEQEIKTQFERRLFAQNEPAISVAVENTPPPATNLYQRTISFDPATTESNYVAKLQLTTSNYDYTKSRPDGGDIRFLDAAGNNLNYYIQNWNSSGTSTIFIKVPTAGTSTISMYYGDKTLLNQSNCAKTLTVCDDFADGQFDSNKWSKVRVNETDWNEGVTENSWFMLKALNGKILGDGTTTAPMILSNDLGNIDYELTTRVKFNPNPTENKQQAGLIIYSDDNNYVLGNIGYINGGKANFAIENDNSMVSYQESWSLPTGSDLKIVKQGQTYTFYYKDQNSDNWIQHGTQIVANLNKQQIGFTALADTGTTISSYFDNIEVKKLATESSLSLGGEQAWNYKRTVNIDPITPDDDWQVKVALTSSNFNYSHAKADGSDLRFLDSNGEELHYWIESWNVSGNSTIWVKVLDGGTNQILMYYGNNSATAISNGNKVFEFFDDFEDGSIDTSKWSNTTGFTESGGYLSGGNTSNRLASTNSFSGNYILETRNFTSAEAANGHMIGGWLGTTTNNYGILFHPTNTWYIRSDSNWTGVNNFTYLNQWIKAKIMASGPTAKTQLYRESDSTYSGEVLYANGGLNNEPIALGKRYDDSYTGQSYTANWDWIFVRKYATTVEPTSTLNEEERWLYRKNITLTPATPLANYQVKVELNSSNFDYDSARDDGGDIRFFDSNGSTLSYWVERWDKNGTSVVWVKIPAAGTSSIQIMYGNQTAESQSNGENTFDFFDNFDNHALDVNKWNWTRESLSNWDEGFTRPDQLTIKAQNGKNMWGADNSAPILLENNINYPISSDFELAVSTETDLTQNYQQAGLIVYESDQTHVQAMHDYNSGQKATFKYEANDSVVTAADESQISNYTDLKVRKSGNDYTMFYKNIETPDWTQHGTSISAVINSLKIGLTSYSDVGPSTNTFYDNIRLRKYSVNDPVATVGAQQTADTVTTDNIINKGSMFAIGATDEKVFATLGGQTIDGSIDTNWNHVVMTYDGEMQKLFVNGQLKQSVEYSLPSWPTNNSDLIVGDQYYGSIDDLLISKKAMSETEVKDWYESGQAYEKRQPAENQLSTQSQSGTVTSGLIGYWDMNETLGQVVNDSSGHNNNGTAINAKIVDGKEGKARNFVADNDYVAIPDSAEYTLANDYSMSAWINPDNIVTDDRAIMGTYNGGSNGFIFDLSPTSGKLQLYFWADGTWNSGPLLAMDGSWKHVVYVKQNNVGTFYVDGVTGNTVTAYQINDGGALQIGGGGTSWPSYRFDGRIDDARIYNRALTPTEVYKLAHQYDPRWTSEDISSQASKISIGGNQESAQYKLALKIIAPGPAGIATYKTSIDDGMTWSEATYTTAIGTSTIRKDFTNTGVDVNWNFGTDFTAGDVFKIASWYTEPRSATRGISRSFPEVANLVATNKSIEILDQSDNSLWMRLTNTTNSGFLNGNNTNIKAVDMTYGQLIAGSDNTTNSIGVLKVDFNNDTARYYRNNELPELLSGNIMSRNFGNDLTNDNSQILNNIEINDVAAKMINNDLIIAAATEGGLNIIDEKNNQVVYGTNASDKVKKIAINDNGDAVISVTSDAKVALALDNITNYQNNFNFTNRNETYRGVTTTDWPADYQLANNADSGSINDVALAGNNYLADEASPQVLIGTNNGAGLIDTMSNNLSNNTDNNRHDGFIKQMTNDYITEGMNGEGVIKGMWLEGDQTGTMVADRSGQNNDLAVHGFSGNGSLGGGDWVTGVRGKALNFDGSNDYLSINDNPDFDFTADDTLSFGGWVKPTVAAEKYLIAQTDGTAIQTSFALKTMASGAGINFQSNVGFDSNLVQTTSKEYPLNAWHYVVGVMDGHNQIMQLYVDGQMESDITTPTGINNSSEPIGLGWSEGGSKYFAGSMSGIFLTNNVLTKNQINKLYQVGLGALNDNSDDLNKIGGNSNNIKAVALDQENRRAFVGTAGGLSEIDLHKDSQAQYWNISSSPALPDNNVQAISYGSNRVLVGTNSGVVNIRTDGSYTATDNIGKLQSGKGRDVYTDGAYNYYVSDKGLDVIKLSNMTRKGYISKENGFNSVVAFGGSVFMGSDQGIWKANVANVIDEYDLTAPAYTTLTVPQLISNKVYDIHGRVIAGKQYLAVGTDNGVELIGNLNGAIYYTIFKNNDNDHITKVWLDEDGDLTYYNATDKTVCVYTNAINPDLYYLQFGTSSYTRRYDSNSTPRLIDNVVNDLVYTANTSTAQSGGNTLYIGTRNGTTVIQEHGIMASSIVKHYVNKLTNDERSGIVLPFANNSLTPEAMNDGTDNSVDQFDAEREKFNLTTDNGLAAYWDFDQTLPGGVADRSGQNNTGYFGTDTGLAGGKIGQGLYLNGKGSYLLANDDHSLHPTNAFTWEGWIWKDPAISNRQTEEPILASKFDSGNKGEFVLYYDKNNKLRLKVADGSSSALSNESSTISPLTWHQVAVTFENGVVKFYIDGALDMTQTLAVTNLAKPPYNNDPTTMSDLYLGNDWQLTKGAFAGYLDEVAYYTRALSFEEIQNHYSTVGTSTNGVTVNNQATLAYPTSGQIVSRSKAQELFNLNFEENLTDSQGTAPAKMVETSLQRPILNQINYGGNSNNNMVLDLGLSGNWDDAGVQTPFVMKDGNTYKMWYGGTDGTNYRIGLATSNDGLSWTKYNGNNCSGTTGDGCVFNISASGFDKINIVSPYIIKEGNSYLMWYGGMGDANWNIGFATSSDGINWSRQNSGNPVMNLGSGSSWDNSSISSPAVLKEGTLYKMWYEGTNGTNTRIGYATSTDGISWTKSDDPDNAGCNLSEADDQGCVLGLGTTGQFNDQHLQVPKVVKYQQEYYLTYAAKSSSGSTYRIGLAKSEDGYSWLKMNDVNAIFDISGAGAWDDDSLFSLQMLIENNNLKSYYSASDGTNIRIGLATMQFGYGRYGKSLYIGNNDQYIYPLKNNINRRAGTISFWTKLDNVNDGLHEVFNVFNKDDNSQDGLYLAMQNNQIAVGLNGEQNVLTAKVDLTNNYWTQIALTWEKPSAENKNLKLYVNGQFVDSTAFTGAISAAYDSLQLGGNPNESRDYLKGNLDDFRIYNQALNVDEINELYGGSIGNSADINHDYDSNTSTPNPLSKGTVEFMYTPDWNSATDNQARTLFDSAGGDTTKTGKQYQNGQTATNRLRIWKDEGTEVNSNDQLHFGIEDNAGNLYEAYTNETINLVAGTKYKIAAMWDLDNNDLTSGGNNILRLIVDNAVVAGDNFTSGVTANKKKNGSDTGNTETILMTVVPEKFYLGSGKPNSQINQILNPSFEEKIGSDPSDWTKTGTINYDQSSNNSMFASAAVAITGPDTTNKLSQTINGIIPGTYTLSWWSKGNAGTDTQKVNITYPGGNQTVNNDPGTNYVFNQITFTTTATGNITIGLSADAGETMWYDGMTLVSGRLAENYQTTSSTYQDFKSTNYLMSQEELNAETLAQTYTTANKNASLAGETNNVQAITVKKVNTSPTASDDILFAGTKGFNSEGAVSQITFGTTDQRTNEYRQTTAGTGLVSNRVNSLSYSPVRNNLAVATDDAGVFGFLEETPAVITVTSPTGTEEWEGGTSHDISWITDGACDHVNIDYSTNSGSEYDHSVVAQIADTGSYTWNPIPTINTNQARVRVECKDVAENLLASNTSTSDFIIDSTKPTVSLNAISNPNGDNLIYGRGAAHDTGGATSINQVQYKIDTGSWNNAMISVNPGTTNIEYDFSTTAISSGAHTIFVRAKDSSLPGGNETDQTMAASRSFNVDELSVGFSRSSFDTTLDVGNVNTFTDSTTVTVSGFGTAYNIGIKANSTPTHSIYDSETIPFYTGNDNWTSGTKGFGWRYANYNNGYYNTFPTSNYQTFFTGKANTNGVPTKVDFKAVADWTVDAGTYNSSVSIIVTPRY